MLTKEWVRAKERGRERGSEMGRDIMRYVDKGMGDSEREREKNG